jgi:hypothetical protein
MEMRKLIIAATIIGFSMGGALAQTTGPAAQDSTKMGTEQGMKKGGMKDGMKGTGNTTGASSADRATVPGNLNAGGTSPSSPNTTQPGSSKTGGNN